MAKLADIFELDEIQTLAFAGGGNRCWWQAGLMARMLEQGYVLPKNLVGTSGGAAMAAACMVDGPDRVLTACRKVFDTCEHAFDWHRLREFRFGFPHIHLYAAWIHTFLHAGNFRRFQSHPSLLNVAVTRPVSGLGLPGSIAVGTLGWFVDELLWHRLHSPLPRYLGLRLDFIPLNQCTDASTAHETLSASAAALPWFPAIQLGASWGMDGGYVDNAAIPPQTRKQKNRTLILLTRHYPGRPALFQHAFRWYWQPSAPVPVSTWDCTRHATIEAAFEQGYTDAQQMEWTFA
ncbi:patatin-like phospholipase family protein [Silvimonas amylolytica]|uniref:Patatin n=1 Tax=Silvimonas amylolytica TaxID=449663 RepID=A0ABQ2PJ53_9NEIS|nr:patatin-like phospholipase family protein [Silvimonas amylolytica]GGP25299.1 patatin [Silvimonas amylolytica]